MMTKRISRRRVLNVAPCMLAVAAGFPQTAAANAKSGLGAKNDEIIRRYYAAWEIDDWHPIDLLLADDFKFSSAAGDDHINKRDFKQVCWESQKNFIERFDLEHVFGSGNEAMVLYVGRTKNGKTFRNVECLRLRDKQVTSIDCFFGSQASFPSAASAEHS